MNTGDRNPTFVEEEPSFTPSSMSSTLAFDSAKKKHSFPPQNYSNSFGTVVLHDARRSTQIDHSINHVTQSVTIDVLNTKH